MTKALDAWALLALLRDEPAAAEVQRAVAAGSVCSWVNLGEVLYIETRRLDEARARSAVDALVDSVRAELPSVERVRVAAALKATGGVSFADCFAAATAVHHGVPLLTGDPELLAAGIDGLQLQDLRG